VKVSTYGLLFSIIGFQVCNSPSPNSNTNEETRTKTEDAMTMASWTSPRPPACANERGRRRWRTGHGLIRLPPACGRGFKPFRSMGRPRRKRGTRGVRHPTSPRRGCRRKTKTLHLAFGHIKWLICSILIVPLSAMPSPTLIDYCPTIVWGTRSYGPLRSWPASSFPPRSTRRGGRCSGHRVLPTLVMDTSRARRSYKWRVKFSRRLDGRSRSMDGRRSSSNRGEDPPSCATLAKT
jgi:hypothetical protein